MAGVRLTSVKAFVRTMTVLGIVYLVVVGISLGVLAGRARHFHHNAPTTEGVVVAINHTRASALGRATPNRTSRQVTIRYTIDGRTGTTVADVAGRAPLEVGSKVQLVYEMGQDGAEDFVLVRDLGIKPLAAVSLFFIFAAGLVACVSLIRLVQGRRLGQPPRQKLGQVATVAVASTPVDHQHRGTRLEPDAAHPVDE